MVLRRLALAVALALLAPAALRADPLRWQVSLAGVPLGRIILENRDAPISTLTLRADIDNTPLGVFNGVFAASSRPGADGTRHFISTIRTSRTQRDTAFFFAPDGQVQDVRLTPADQRTELSEAKAVPAGLLDPVAAFGRLVTPAGAGSCPEGFRYYDGRRVVALTATGTRRTGARLRCKMTYEVVAGPGHLSPLDIGRFYLVLEYSGAGSDSLFLEHIKLRSGIFILSLRRKTGAR